MNEPPTTSQVLDVIRAKGVIVGSWPAKRSAAKDIDVVVRDRKPEEARNPLFEKLLRKWRESCRSSVPGHLFVDAVPQPIELFEGCGFPPDDPAKSAGRLTYHQAVRRAEWIDCYGVAMRAVRR